jgi:hypothetical protein
MNTRRKSNPARNAPQAFSILVAGILALAPAFVQAQSARKNPASKVYIADMSGDATIDTGEAIEDLSKRSVYTVQGAVIETKNPENENDRSKHFSTMVYSNGTGAFFDADTRVEVKRFMQEPFTPNRNDMDVEPSISQTQAFVSRGAVGLCNSKFVAGSNMVYNTQHGSINIRGKKLVIEAQNDVTRISMLEGESTVRGGAQDTGGHTLKVGQQALIRRGEPGQANIVQIQDIPREEMAKLDDQVAMACMAKKTVYFEVRERTVEVPGTTSTAAAASESAAGSSTTETATGGGTFTRVTAFDGGNTGTTTTVVIREIVPVEIIPTTLPVEMTISNAMVRTPGR